MVFTSMLCTSRVEHSSQALQKRSIGETGGVTGADPEGTPPPRPIPEPPPDLPGTRPARNIWSLGDCARGTPAPAVAAIRNFRRFRVDMLPPPNGHKAV